MQRQRDDVLGFARVLDGKLVSIPQRRRLPLYWVRQVCRLHRKKPTSTAYWQRWNELHARLGVGFRDLIAEVRAALDDTPRSSSMVENLNSRLRRYFFLRRHLGDAYLSLLQFFLNHRVFMRSRRVERVGKTPRELLGFERHVPARPRPPSGALRVLLHSSSDIPRPPTPAVGLRSSLLPKIGEN